jgi:hypothetical protein
MRRDKLCRDDAEGNAGTPFAQEDEIGVAGPPVTD